MGVAGVLLLLGACGSDSRSAEESVPAVAPVAVEPAGVANPPTPAPTTVEGATAASEPTIEAAHARRLADAQVYLNRAREDAEGRYRQAMDNCQQGTPAVDFDTCVATAEESLQVELRAARVEFDARMAPSE